MLPRMPKAHEEWKVLEHGPIVELAENIWWVTAPCRHVAARNMVVVQLADGRLSSTTARLRDKERSSSRPGHTSVFS